MKTLLGEKITIVVFFRISTYCCWGYEDGYMAYLFMYMAMFC